METPTELDCFHLNSQLLVKPSSLLQALKHTGPSSRSQAKTYAKMPVEIPITTERNTDLTKPLALEFLALEFLTLTTKHICSTTTCYAISNK